MRAAAAILLLAGGLAGPSAGPPGSGCSPASLELCGDAELEAMIKEKEAEIEQIDELSAMSAELRKEKEAELEELEADFQATVEGLKEIEELEAGRGAEEL
ncbi:unnamed protein product [Prorocentrum cordatum]|uniref:Uncharacterized protein n=1 Tax=Prorocentrum cordatum TaxID=2364126 RepID=A0ABN9TLU7_9DINO|nr:unnamed protein product [Polarella glacialis]